MKCDKCNKEIGKQETYFELQEWEMCDGDGSEGCDTRLCQTCYDKYRDFINQ